MLRTLQRKLVVIYLLLILVAMELTGIYLLQSLRTYYENNFRLNLHAQAQLLGALSQRYLVEGNSLEPADPMGLGRLIGEWGAGTGVSAMILDSNGVVLGASRLQSGVVGNHLITDEVTHALGGSVGEKIGQDPDTGAPTLFLAVPIHWGGQVAGVVYLQGSLQGTYDILADIRRILMAATALALGVTAVMGTILARTITGPVRELTDQAVRLARGEFEQEIHVRSTDEVGRLASAFNYMADRLKETLNAISEERNTLEAILTNMADGLIAIDSQDKILRVNRAAARMLDLDADAAVGLGLAQLIPEPQLHQTLIAAVAAGRTRTLNLTYAKTAGLRTILCFITPLRADRVPGAGAVLVFHDVTELNRLEELRREFVANVSHELKTPLTTVKSYVETLLDGAGADADVTMRFLQVVAAETDRMVRLVRDLLHMSQLDSGIVHWDIEAYDVKAIIEEALAKLSVPIANKTLHMSTEWPDTLPSVLVDRDKILQVFLNVIANAIDFTAVGGRITVAAASQYSLVQIWVRDNGPGIPGSDLDRIFERFYRVDKARTRTLGGTGLGLAIARQIVEGLHGNIAIASEVGVGTEVTITLPAADWRAEGK